MEWCRRQPRLVPLSDAILVPAASSNAAWSKHDDVVAVPTYKPHLTLWMATTHALWMIRCRVSSSLPVARGRTDNTQGEWGADNSHLTPRTSHQLETRECPRFELSWLRGRVCHIPVRLCCFSMLVFGCLLIVPRLWRGLMVSEPVASHPAGHSQHTSHNHSPATTTAPAHKSPHP